MNLCNRIYRLREYTMPIKSDKKNNLQGRGSDFIIRINNDQPALFKGKIEHLKTGEVQYFNDFLEMVMLIESKLDDQNYPQKDTELRSFS